MEMTKYFPTRKLTEYLEFDLYDDDDLEGEGERVPAIPVEKNLEME